VDLGEAAARLGVPVEDVDRVHRLAGDRPSAPLPAKADALAILDRLAVRPDDAAEIMAGWPDPDSPLWTPELRWLLDRSIALVRADLDEPYTAFSCGSWLLDPQLLEYLPEDSNIVRFQRRFELEPYEEPEGLDADVEVLRFVFRTLTTPLDQLPRRTVLQRAIVDHLKAGRHWYWRSGHFPI
jgi:GNAT-like C-terminal domain